LPRQQLFADYGLAAEFRISDVMSPRGTAVFATEAFVQRSYTCCELVGQSLGGHRGGEVVDPAFAEGRRIVYVSFGSQAWYQPRRFERIFETADALGLAVIAAMGDLADSDIATAARARGHVCVGYAAQLPALRIATAAVTHGGANSVMECLARGVPMLVAPICNDQPHTAWFVARARCGVSVDLDNGSDAMLCEALTRVTEDEPMRVASRRIADSYRQDGSVYAAELTERAAR
jgi:UDP:flavonoid glycosyltransferase YjiC (YdhE family)